MANCSKRAIKERAKNKNREYREVRERVKRSFEREKEGFIN